MGEANIMVYVVVGVLGLAAAVLGFAAEATKIKVSDVTQTIYSCEYPSTPANILGYIAALLLFIVLVTTSAVTRCACCQRNTRSAGAIFCFVISCVSSVIGIGLLVAAANLSTRQEFLDSAGICYTVRPGVFAAGGGLALVACILGLCAYRSANKYPPQQAPAAVPYQGGIAMGNPQFDTASTYSNPKQQGQHAV